MEPATRVVVSHPSDLSDWGRERIREDSVLAYLPKAHDRAREGDVWEEFTGVGCCGNTLDVPLRVERVEGGAMLTEETTVDVVERDACEVEGGWRVQSADGPTT